MVENGIKGNKVDVGRVVPFVVENGMKGNKVYPTLLSFAHDYFDKIISKLRLSELRLDFFAKKLANLKNL